jgi:hypothetical protein
VQLQTSTSLLDAAGGEQSQRADAFSLRSAWWELCTTEAAFLRTMRQLQVRVWPCIAVLYADDARSIQTLFTIVKDHMEGLKTPIDAVAGISTDLGAIPDVARAAASIADGFVAIFKSGFDLDTATMFVSKVRESRVQVSVGFLSTRILVADAASACSVYRVCQARGRRRRRPQVDTVRPCRVGQRLDFAAGDVQSRRFKASCGSERLSSVRSCADLQMKDLVIEPVQRLARYPLLLRRIHKYAVRLNIPGWCGWMVAFCAIKDGSPECAKQGTMPSKMPLSNWRSTYFVWTMKWRSFAA